MRCSQHLASASASASTMQLQPPCQPFPQPPRRPATPAQRLLLVPQIGGAAFGNAGRLLVAVLLYSELFSVCVDLIILEGDNLAAVFPQWAISLGRWQLTPAQASSTEATDSRDSSDTGPWVPGSLSAQRHARASAACMH
jgi:hypothetical protein